MRRGGDEVGECRLEPIFFVESQKIDRLRNIVKKRNMCKKDCIKKNKARNSHKPRLGECVQQGNMRSGGSFFVVYSCIQKYFARKISSLKIGSENFLFVFILM